MATKIATPVTQGGQNIGGVKSQAADVQYQKFDTNKDMFGAVEAEQFATIGNAIVSGASEIRDAAIAEDKRNSLNAETIAIESEAFHKGELNKLIGQERIDYIKTNKLQSGGIGANPIQYGAEADKDIDNISNAMTPVGKAGLGQVMQVRKANFGLTMKNEVTTAQLAIDGKLIADRIVANTEDAVAHVGQTLPMMPNGLPFASLNAFLVSKESVIKTAVDDKDIGLGRGMDRKAKDVLIKKQTAAMYKAVLVEMMSQGDISGAIDLLDEQMTKDGALRGTVEGTELQGQLLKAKQTFAGQDKFKDIINEAGSTEAKDLIPLLSKITDPTLAASTWAAFATLNKKVTAGRTARRTDAVIGLIKHFNNGGTLADADPKILATIAQEVPQMLSPKSREAFVKAGVRQQDLENHTDKGGSVSGSTQITADFKSMADKDPESFSKLFETEAGRDRVRALVNVDQMAELTIAAQKAKEKYNMMIGASTKEYGELLKSLGFTLGTTKYFDLLSDKQLRERISDEKLAFYKQHNREMRDTELMPIVAQQVLSIRSKDNSFIDDYSVYALSELDKQGGKDVSTLKLEADSQNDLRNIGRIYQLSRADVETAIKAVKKNTGTLSSEVTLENIDKVIRLKDPTFKRPTFKQFNAAQEALQDASIAAGYNYDFMEFASREGANGKPLSNKILGALDKVFKRDPKLYAKQYQRWIDGK